MFNRLSQLFSNQAKEGGGLWPVGSIIVANVFSFINAVILTRIFDADAYGVYRYVLAWIVVSSFFTLSYSHLPVTQAVIEGKERTFFSALTMRMKFGILGSLFFACIAAYYFIQGNTLLATLFAIYVPFVVASETLTSFVAFLHGKRWMRTNFYFDLGSAILGTLAIIVVALTTHDIVLAFLANVVSTFIPRVFGVWFVSRHVDYRSGSEQIEGYSIKLTISGVFEIISQMVDKTIVFHLLGAQGLTLYIFATIFVDQFRELGRVLVWKYIFLDFKQGSKIHVQSIIIFAFIAFILYAAVSPILYIVFFPVYTAVTGLSMLYALSFFMLPTYFSMYTYQATKATRYVGMYNVATLVFVITGVGVGATVAGVPGAVIGLLLAKLTVGYGMMPFFTKNIFLDKSE